MVRSHSVAYRYVSFLRQAGLYVLLLATAQVGNLLADTNESIAEAPYVSQSAVDNTGRVWLGGQSLLRYLDGSDWKEISFDWAQDIYPNFFCRFHDGHVMCLWSNGRDYLASDLSGDSAKPIASFPVPAGCTWGPEVTVDSKDNIWITEEPGQIIRITRQGAAECLYTVPKDQFFTADNRPYDNNSRNYLRATEDPAGRMWFWGCEGPEVFEATMRGILIYDGTNFTPHPVIPGLPAKGVLTCLYKTASGKMRAGVDGAGLFDIDPITMKATSVPDPTGGALKQVWLAFTAAGANWYLAGDSTRLALWREQRSQWSKVLDDLENPEIGQRTDLRPDLPAKGGFFFSCFTGPVWFIPDQGSPVPIDWKIDVPESDVVSMLGTADGRFVFNDFLASIDFPPRPADHRPKTVKVSQIVFDSAGHGWAVFPGSKQALSEWDGVTWTLHAFPDPKASPEEGLLIDSRDRIWPLPDYTDTPFDLYDGKAHRWQRPGNLEAALQTTTSEPPGYWLYGESRTRDGRICFIENKDVDYFDGQSWHDWDVLDIRHGRGDGFDFLGFDSTGQLELYDGTEHLKLTASNTWQNLSSPSPTPEPADPPRAPIASELAAAVLSPKVLNDDILNFARDNAGIVWLVRWNENRGLYKALGDLCVPAFGPGETDPFAENRSLDEAHVDCRGNTFLKTNDEYLVLPPVPVPSPRVAITAIDGRYVTACFSASRETSSSGHAVSKPQIMPYYSWRLDGGDWSDPAADEWVKIEVKEDVPHKLEVRALDGRLNISATAGVANFRINSKDRVAVIAAMDELRDSGSHEEMKKAADDVLIQYPAVSLPALKAEKVRGRFKDGDQPNDLDEAIRQVEGKLLQQQH